MCQGREASIAVPVTTGGHFQNRGFRVHGGGPSFISGEDAIVLENAGPSWTSDPVAVFTTDEDDEDSGAASGWSIAFPGRFACDPCVNFGTTNEWLDASFGALRISIKGTVNPSTATLSALALSGVTLDQPFASATEDYTATVVNSVMQTTVTATPTHSGATVAFEDGDDDALTNPLPLAVGDNVIKAVVTAEDGTTMKTYMVTVTRGATGMPAIVTDGVQVTSMAAADQTYRLGETIEITVTFDNAVTVGTSGGTPRIKFRLDGALIRWAEYSRGSGGTDLVFTYTVQSGDKDDDGIWLPANFLELQSGTIRAAADNTVDAILTYAEPGTQSEHKVDGSTVPGAPTSLTATASGAAAIDLSWTAPSSNGGALITGYKIETSPDGTSDWTGTRSPTATT